MILKEKSMIIKQFYEKCLSQASYYIEHNGEAAIIDPLRDTDHYQLEASKNGTKIKYIFETHFHADFVSGHLELSRNTGSPIIFGPRAQTGFDFYQGRDQEIFNLGGVNIRLLHTPGHTLESSCYLLEDEQGKPVALFTGDTLFLGDVGRPDLAQDEKGQLSEHELAGILFDSIRKQIISLPDDVTIYPGHGAGSACGKNLSTLTSDLLGNQKKENYALNPSLSRLGFITILCSDLPTAPDYFKMNVSLNREGYEYLHVIHERSMNAINVEVFAKKSRTIGSIVLDVRSAEEFAKAHVPNAINIGIDGSFAPWVGALIPSGTSEILLVCEPSRTQEVITRLSRIGYHQCSGYLSGGMENWMQQGFATEKVESILAKDLWDYQGKQKLSFVDVRNWSERQQDSLLGSIHIPLSKSPKINVALDLNQQYLVYCAGGYRSMMFISMMKSKGFHGWVNVSGGLNTIRKAEQNSIGSLIERKIK